jgi:excinuclease UvrABC nuclease subunit
VLLQKFGSIEGILSASLEDLTSIKGITEDLAQALRSQLE